MKDHLTIAQRRYFSGVEVRTSADDTAVLRVGGYAARFDNLSDPLWFGREKISPGAFAEAIDKSDVRFLVNHTDLPLARKRPFAKGKGTLGLIEDDRGLAFEAELDLGDPDVQRLEPKIRRGDLDQMSFAFSIGKESFSKDEEGRDIRTVESVKELFDISIVSFPAYSDTSVSLRASQELVLGGSEVLFATMIEKLRVGKELSGEELSLRSELLQKLDFGSFPGEAASTETSDSTRVESDISNRKLRLRLLAWGGK